MLVVVWTGLKRRLAIYWYFVFMMRKGGRGRCSDFIFAIFFLFSLCLVNACAFVSNGSYYIRKFTFVLLFLRRGTSNEYFGVANPSTTILVLYQ